MQASRFGQQPDTEEVNPLAVLAAQSEEYARILEAVEFAYRSKDITDRMAILTFEPADIPLFTIGTTTAPSGTVKQIPSGLWKSAYIVPSIRQAIPGTATNFIYIVNGSRTGYASTWGLRGPFRGSQVSFPIFPGDQTIQLMYQSNPAPSIAYLIVLSTRPLRGRERPY